MNASRKRPHEERACVENEVSPRKHHKRSGDNGFISRLTRARAKDQASGRSIHRATTFENPAQAELDHAFDLRNEDLTVKEDADLGPIEFTAPHYDPTWQNLEPNSGTRLKSRHISHEALQEMLTGRYILSPSQLYSMAKQCIGSDNWDVPLAGDFVVMGVFADKSDIRITTLSGENEHFKPQRYISFKLLDMRNTSKGDSMVNVCLFESEYRDSKKGEDGKKGVSYRGGGGGVYEKWWKCPNGSLVAILNPRIIRLQRSTDQTGILSLKPHGAEAIVLVGISKDLGQCTALKRGGETCGSWCDLRFSPICEYHTNQSVKTTRSNRAEFFSSSSGMENFISKGFQQRPAHSTLSSLKPELHKVSSQGKRYIEGVAVYVMAGQSNPKLRHGPTQAPQGRQRERSNKQDTKGELDVLLRAKLDRKDESVGATYLARRIGKADENEKAEYVKKTKQLMNRKQLAFPPETLKILGFDPVKSSISMKDKDHIHTATFKKLEAGEAGDDDLEIV